MFGYSETYYFRCRKLFTSNSNMTRHFSKCSGKGLIQCEYCQDYYETIESYVDHFKKSHKIPSSQFTLVNTFNPKRTKTSKKYRRSDQSDKSKSTEPIFKEYYKFFLFGSELKTSEEVFDNVLLKDLEYLLLNELNLSFGGINFNLYSEILVTRIEDENDFPLYVHTLSSSLFHSSQVKSVIEKQLRRYTVQCENLYALDGSGIAISAIKNLRIQISHLPHIKSGCVDIKLEYGLSKALLRGLTLIR